MNLACLVRREAQEALRSRRVRSGQAVRQPFRLRLQRTVGAVQLRRVGTRPGTVNAAGGRHPLFPGQRHSLDLPGNPQGRQGGTGQRRPSRSPISCGLSTCNWRPPGFRNNSSTPRRNSCWIAWTPSTVVWTARKNLRNRTSRRPRRRRQSVRDTGDRHERRTPSFLDKPGLQLLLFGGKGGVGKTTCAASAALRMAGLAPSRSILLVSTDPAHSLRDSLAGLRPPANLKVLELDAQEYLGKFRAKNGQKLREIAAAGTFLDDEDIDRFLNLSLPGLDELMAFLEISGWLEDRRYDSIVVDTAPSGHTLRLLAMPGLIRKWLHMLDTLLAKRRYMRKVFKPEQPGPARPVRRPVGRLAPAHRDSAARSVALPVRPGHHRRAARRSRDRGAVRNCWAGRSRHPI